MTVKELFDLYDRSFIYDVKIDLVDETLELYESFLEIPENVLTKEVANFCVYEKQVCDGKTTAKYCVLSIELKEYGSFNPYHIGKNTEKYFLSKIKGMNPREIIKFMKDFFDNCAVDCKSQDIKSYASYLYCKENKLV